jgi:hypothetical protein
MSVRNLLPIALLLGVVSYGCGGESPTQADGVVMITQTTTTAPPTTTTVIPQLNAGVVAASPAGVGLVSATVYNFAFATPSSGGVPPYAFSWNFGDGVQGAGAAASHVYASTGRFTATVTATDSRGISAQASALVVVENVTGSWVVEFSGGGPRPMPVDIVQNQTAVTATINDIANGFGFASGTGNVSNPRGLSISATFATGMPFAVTFIGRVDETNLTIWSGTVTGFPGCPCQFTATRQ